MVCWKGVYPKRAAAVKALCGNDIVHSRTSIPIILPGDVDIAACIYRQAGIGLVGGAGIIIYLDVSAPGGAAIGALGEEDVIVAVAIILPSDVDIAACIYRQAGIGLVGGAGIIVDSDIGSKRYCAVGVQCPHGEEDVVVAGGAGCWRGIITVISPDSVDRLGCLVESDAVLS